MTHQRGGDVSAIVVSYNTRNLLLACIESLRTVSSNEPLAEIIVVDSGSTDESADAVQKEFPGTRVIQVPNRGYGAAANAGAALTRCDYLLILNADTEVRPHAIERLREALADDENAGLAGPTLRYPDGSIQPSRRRFPTVLTSIFESTVLEEWWPNNPWANDFHMHDVPAQSIETVDWVVGAALMVKTEAFRSVEGFDPKFRMYSEEIDLAYRMMQAGWQTRFVLGAEITHYEGSSTSQDVPRRQAEFDDSRIRLQRRIHGKRGALLLFMALRAGYLIHICREGAKWMLGHRRELRARRVRLYTRLLIKRWHLGG